MSHSAARSVVAALTAVLVLLAGCATTVGGQGEPITGAGWTDPSVPLEPPTGPPTGPAPGATVVARWTEYPGFFCPVDRTLVATTTVYSDGSVLLSDGIGASCMSPPHLTAGFADLVALKNLLSGYFDSPDSAVDMDHLPIADLGWSEVSYVDQQGGEHVAAAYGLFVDDSKLEGVSAAVRQARAALRAVSEALDDTIGPDTAAWTPDTVVVVFDGSADAELDAAEWPLPGSTDLADLLASDRGCLAITGAPAATMWTAAGSREFTSSPWTVDGRAYQLAIGATLPGSTPCDG